MDIKLKEDQIRELELKVQVRNTVQCLSDTKHFFGLILFSFFLFLKRVFLQELYCVCLPLTLLCLSGAS